MAEPTKNVRISGVPSTEAHGFRGATGVFQKLQAQHEQLAALFERAKSENEPARRGELWTEIRRQLLSHERAEELEIYAALEGYDAARDLLDEHSRDVRELEFVISDLELVDFASNEWVAHLLEVAALFEEHVREEEESFFPVAQELLGEQAAHGLEEGFASVQREIIDTLA
jgi:hemerythrin superfamily protein